MYTRLYKPWKEIKTKPKTRANSTVQWIYFMLTPPQEMIQTSMGIELEDRNPEVFVLPEKLKRNRKSNREYIDVLIHDCSDCLG